MQANGIKSWKIIPAAEFLEGLIKQRDLGARSARHQLREACLGRIEIGGPIGGIRLACGMYIDGDALSKAQFAGAAAGRDEIGRAAGRERGGQSVEVSVGAVSLKK